MFLKIFLFFTIFPIIELAIFIKIGAYVGIVNTLVLIVVTALVGSYLVRMEGLNVLYRFQENMAKGIFPTEELFDGIFVLVAGALLITPGLLTDTIGFLLITPASKAIIKKILKAYIKKKTDSGAIDVNFRSH